MSIKIFTLFYRRLWQCSIGSHIVLCYASHALWLFIFPQLLSEAYLSRNSVSFFSFDQLEILQGARVETFIPHWFEAVVEPFLWGVGNWMLLELDAFHSHFTAPVCHAIKEFCWDFHKKTCWLLKIMHKNVFTSFVAWP